MCHEILKTNKFILKFDLDLIHCSNTLVNRGERSRYLVLQARTQNLPAQYRFLRFRNRNLPCQDKFPSEIFLVRALSSLSRLCRFLGRFQFFKVVELGAYLHSISSLNLGTRTYPVESNSGQQWELQCRVPCGSRSTLFFCLPLVRLR